MIRRKTMKRTILIALILCTVLYITASSCLAQVIYGCVKNNGQLTIVSGPGQCKHNETPISWNATGGIDQSKVYMKICDARPNDSLADPTCLCNANDMLLSGGAACLPASGSWSLYISGPSFAIPGGGIATYPTGWYALCIDVNDLSDHFPTYEEVFCLMH
jgi:hypothetical protein